MAVFSIFKEPGKKRSKKIESIPSGEAYYGATATRISFFKYTFAFLSLVFVIFSFVFFSDELSIENFRYMLKFVSFDPVTVSTDNSAVRYEHNADNIGAVIRGDLAVVNKSGITVTDFTSRKLLKSKFSYSNPALRTSDKNIFVYDAGGHNLEIFTSYSSVYKQTFEYPILGMDVTKNGAYAVISKKKNYRSGVRVYDENFNETYSLFFGAGSDDRDREIIDVSLREDRKRLLAAAFYTDESGEYITSLEIIDTEKEDNFDTLTIRGEMPWRVEYRFDGSFWILTDRALRCYSEDKKLLSEEYFGFNAPKKFRLSDTYAALTFSSQSSQSAEVTKIFVPAGETVNLQTKSLRDILFHEKEAYILSDGKIILYDFDEKKTYELSLPQSSSEYISVLYSEQSDKAAVFSPSQTYIVGADFIKKSADEKN